MENNGDTLEYELISVIVNFGLGSKVLRTAKQHGIPGGTIYLGMGTVKNRILEFLELTDIRKEIVIMAADKSVVDGFIESIDKEFDLKKPYHGIAFTMPLSALVGTGRHDYQYNTVGGSNKLMYNSILVVVDMGKAEQVMAAATEAGARGGTVMKARGSSMRSSKLFQMDIEPEREMIMILSEAAATEKIVTTIRDRLEIGKGGSGIIFCQAVSNAYGIS